MISLRWMMQIALRHALIPQLIWLKAADTVSLGTASSRLSRNPWAGIHLYRQFTLEQTGYSALCKCGHFSSVWIRNNFVLEQIMLDDVSAHVSLFLNRCFVHSIALPCGSELSAAALPPLWPPAWEYIWGPSQKSHLSRKQTCEDVFNSNERKGEASLAHLPSFNPARQLCSWQGRCSPDCPRAPWTQAARAPGRAAPGRAEREDAAGEGSWHRPDGRSCLDCPGRGCCSPAPVSDSWQPINAGMCLVVSIR